MALVNTSTRDYGHMQFILRKTQINLPQYRQYIFFGAILSSEFGCDVNISEMTPPPPPLDPLNERKSNIEIPSTLYNSAKGTEHHRNTVKISMLPSAAINISDKQAINFPHSKHQLVSKEHQNLTIFASPETVKRIYSHAHNNHYDVITSMPAFVLEGCTVTLARKVTTTVPTIYAVTPTVV